LGIINVALYLPTRPAVFDFLGRVLYSRQVNGADDDEAPAAKDNEDDNTPKSPGLLFEKATIRNAEVSERVHHESSMDPCRDIEAEAGVRPGWR
ncbi:hypothetical protein FRB94_013723, partial [Tulasnella sp. JGI-2019a]